MSEDKGYYHTPDTVQEYIKLAKDVNSLELINKFQKYLKTNATILELGSGPGTDWKILNESFNVTGSDNSTEFLKFLKESYPDGDFMQVDACELDVDQKFDGVYSNKVLHHLNDEELKKSINQQSAILTEDGIICHSFWKGEGSEVFKGLFVNYHTENKIKDVFAQHFEIELLESYQEFDPNDSIVIIARKK